MKLNPVEKSKRQVPDWLDNLKQKPEDQVTLYWKSFPTAGDVSTYKAFKYDTHGNVQLDYNDIMLLKKHLDHIDNLEIGKPIITPEDLLNSTDLRLESLVSIARNYAIKDDEDLTEGENEASE